MNSRERILERLRANRKPFEDAPPRPAQYLPVTRLDNSDLVARFRAEVERLKGELHTPADDETAIDLVLELIGGDPAVIAWERLPLPGLVEALAKRNVKVIIPRVRGDQRREELLKAEPIRVGITGADAAFATTGTLALVTDEAQGRIPSLLPPVHIALLRPDRLFPRLEDWIKIEGRAAVARSSSVAFVTGPSRTGDIEMASIIGVHGPGVEHIVLLP